MKNTNLYKMWYKNTICQKGLNCTTNSELSNNSELSKSEKS